MDDATSVNALWDDLLHPPRGARTSTPGVRTSSAVLTGLLGAGIVTNFGDKPTQPPQAASVDAAQQTGITPNTSAAPAGGATPALGATPAVGATPADGATISAIQFQFRAPQFCTSDPSMWFNLIECNFKAHRITTSMTKFSHATSLLPQEVLTKVADVISKALASTTPYEDLKAAVIKRMESSVTTRLQELLSKEELGNEKPSDLLRRMQRLLNTTTSPDSFDHALFRQLFYQRLPADIQKNLFTVKDKISLEDLATLADDYMSTVTQSRTTVSHVTTGAAAPTTEMQQLTQLVTHLTMQVNSLANRMTQAEEQPRSRGRSRSRSTNRSNKKKFFCWYHFQYGPKAKKCVEPCDWKKSQENTEGGH